MCFFQVGWIEFLTDSPRGHMTVNGCGTTHTHQSSAVNPKLHSPPRSISQAFWFLRVLLVIMEDCESTESEEGNSAGGRRLVSGQGSSGVQGHRPCFGPSSL